MRILVVNFQDRHHPCAGGAEVHLHELFGRLAGRGHHVTLLVSGWSGAPSRQAIDGIGVHRVGSRATFPVLARRYFRRRLSGPWDVIVEDANKLPLAVHRWSGTPTALLVHHLFGRTAFSATAWPIASMVYVAERLLGALYPGVPVVAVSESTAAELTSRGIDADRIWVIPNGVAMPRGGALSTGEERRRPALLYVGRLQRYKRVDVLLHAMAKLRERGVDAELQIVGDGAVRAPLHRLARELPLGDSVRFLGRVSESDKQTLLARASIHVIASEKEGWGLSVLEAGAHGVPTIATNVPGLCDSVIHERTGRLVPGGDATAFADAVQSLLAQPELRRELGRTAKCFASIHSWDVAADATERFLADVARGVTRGGDRIRMQQRPPFQRTTLPRTGGGIAPYGAQRLIVEVGRGEHTVNIAASLGATDPAGRRPALEFEDLSPDLAGRLLPARGVLARREGTALVWELIAWPEPPLRWIETTLREVLQSDDVLVRWKHPATLDSHPVSKAQSTR